MYGHCEINQYFYTKFMEHCCLKYTYLIMEMELEIYVKIYVQLVFNDSE